MLEMLEMIDPAATILIFMALYFLGRAVAHGRS
jgi:hypothetical protein